jgi:hypothetical protein
LLLPHLSDDELFGLRHILNDGSREPIARYLESLFERDTSRTYALLRGLEQISPKCGIAILRTLECAPAHMARELATAVATRSTDSSARSAGLSMLKARWPDEETRQLIKARAKEGFHAERDEVLRLFERLDALRLLASDDRWADEEVRSLAEAIATNRLNEGARLHGIGMLVSRRDWIDDRTCAVVQALCRATSDAYYRDAALLILAQHDIWSDDTTRQLILQGIY